MTDIKTRLIDGMRGQAVKLPNREWLLLDEKNLTLIADRLLRTPGIAIVPTVLIEQAVEAYRVLGWSTTTHRKMSALAAAAAVQAQEPK